MQILKFSAIWCPACLIMNSRYNQISEEYHIPITEYDYDIDIEMVKQYKIENILPVAILINDQEEEIERLVGELSIRQIQTILKKYQS